MIWSRWYLSLCIWDAVGARLAYQHPDGQGGSVPPSPRPLWPWWCQSRAPLPVRKTQETSEWPEHCLCLCVGTARCTHRLHTGPPVMGWGSCSSFSLTHIPGTCLAVSPASPCAWNACVTRKAPLEASSSGSDEDEQKVAGASEAISMGPSQEGPPLPTAAPRFAGRVGPGSPHCLGEAWPFCLNFL